MKRAWLLVPGLAALALSGFLREAPPAAGSSLEALGRSLGGWRVLAVDVLALRAEALRRQGRLEELPALYEAMVELDPGNAAGTAALADAIATFLVPDAPARDERRARWLEAFRLVERGLAVHPESALLATQASALLLGVAESHPDLERDVDAIYGGPSTREALGLGYLLAAVRTTESLPRGGRAHLSALAREAPRLAARALVRGQSAQEVLARLDAADELTRLYPQALAELELLSSPTPGAPEGLAVPLPVLIKASSALVHAALEAREAGVPAQLRPGVETFEARVGTTPASTVLSAWAHGR